MAKMLLSWALASICSVAAAHDTLPRLPSLSPNGTVYIVLEEGPNGLGAPFNLRARGGLSHSGLPSVDPQPGTSQDLNIVRNFISADIRNDEGTIDDFLVGGLATEREARIVALDRVGADSWEMNQYWIYEVSTAPHMLTLDPETALQSIRNFHVALGGIVWSQVRRFTVVGAPPPTFDDDDDDDDDATTGGAAASSTKGSATSSILAVAKRLFRTSTGRARDSPERRAAETEAAQLELDWAANHDFDTRWTLFGATQIPRSYFRVADPIGRAQDLMRSLTSPAWIPDDQRRQTLREMLDRERNWDTARLQSSALAGLNLDEIQIPRRLQIIIASGLASPDECGSAIRFFHGSESAFKKRAEAKGDTCTQLIDLAKDSNKIPRPCRRVHSLELEMALATDWSSGTFDIIAGTVEGSAGKAEFTFADSPDAGTRKIIPIDVKKYFGSDDIDIKDINAITLTADGHVLGFRNDEFVVQDVALRAVCADPAYRAQDNKYIGIHHAYRHPGQGHGADWKLFGGVMQRRVATLPIHPSQWSFSPPCSHIKDLRYEFQMGSSIGDGAVDTIYFKLGGDGKRIKLGRDIAAGTSFSGIVDLNKTYDAATVHIKALNKLTLWDELPGILTLRRGDEWKFQGMVFTGTCAAKDANVTMRRYAAEGANVKNHGDNRPVWAGEIVPADWVQVV